MVNGGQDGLLDKIEQILKEALGSVSRFLPGPFHAVLNESADLMSYLQLRKRGLVAELGDQVDKLLEEVCLPLLSSPALHDEVTGH